MQKQQTLIQRLGFEDPDRRLPRHDLACAYLSTRAKEIADDHLRRVPLGDGVGLDRQVTTYGVPTLTEWWASTEVAISSGHWIVGFRDVVIRYSAYHKGRAVQYRHLAPKLDNPTDDAQPRQISIEVKISPTTIGETLRQIEFYRTTMRERGFWYLVTAYPLSEPDKLVLKQASIRHFLLGQQFDDWCAKQVATTSSDEI